MESYYLKPDEEVNRCKPTQVSSNKKDKDADFNEPNFENKVNVQESSKISQELAKSDLEEGKEEGEKGNKPEDNIDTYEPDETSSEDDLESRPYLDEYHPELANASEFLNECNPTHEFYLAKTSQIPEHLSEPKYMTKNMFEKVVMASYSRSGNTLLRKYLEDITGVITGSDVDARHGLCLYLLDKGMKGEGKINNRVWIVKSHFPVFNGYKNYMANKCILLVRNPMDCIMSLYNMIVTGTHYCTIANEDFEKFNSWFDLFLSQEIVAWRDFHAYWMDQPIIPTYIVRYEDLLSDTKNTLLDLFKFLLNQKDLEGTLIEALVDYHTKSKSLKEVYKPRKGKINCNKDLYKEHQIKQIKQVSGQILKRLGYVEEKSGKSSLTSFYVDDEDIELSSQYNCETLTKNGQEQEIKDRYRYDELNEIMLDQVCSEDYRNCAKDVSNLSSIEVNYPEDNVTNTPEFDNEGRRHKLFKDKLREHVKVVFPDGCIKKAVVRHKS